MKVLKIGPGMSLTNPKDEIEHAFHKMTFSKRGKQIMLKYFPPMLGRSLLKNANNGTAR